MIDDQEVLLSELKRRVFELRGLATNQRCDIPMAVVIPKMDAWHELLDENIESPVSEGQLDLGAIDRNSAAMYNLIRGLCPHILASAESFSSNVKYFAVSAFGHTPVEVKKGKEVFIVPDPQQLTACYTEHPMLWLLSRAVPELVPSH